MWGRGQRPKCIGLGIARQCRVSTVPKLMSQCGALVALLHFGVKHSRFRRCGAGFPSSRIHEVTVRDRGLGSVVCLVL